MPSLYVDLQKKIRLGYLDLNEGKSSDGSVCQHGISSV